MQTIQYIYLLRSALQLGNLYSIGNLNFVIFCICLHIFIAFTESSKVPQIEKVLTLEANSTGQISSPHFPENSPQNIIQATHLVAPVGYLIELNVSYRVPYFNGSCNTSFQVYDETLAVADKTSCILSTSCVDGAEESVVIQSNLNKLKIILSVGELSNTILTRFNATYSVKSGMLILRRMESVEVMIV